jgi:ribosome-binding factor A
MSARARRRLGERPFPRVARVNEAIRHAIAVELERFSDGDERLGLVTVTGVEVSPDLQSARVYFDSLPPERAEAIEEVRGRLQACIAREVRLKRTPHLSFVADPGVEAGQRIESILARLRSGSEGGHGVGSSPEPASPASSP